MMNNFKDINMDEIDIPFISQLNEKKSIRFFNKVNNIHNDIIIHMEPCLCPFGLKKFDYIYVVTCSLANSSRKRVKDINSFEEKVEKKFNKLYPQFKRCKLHKFLDENYRFTLSVNINDLKVFDQKLNLLTKENIKAQCIIEPIICLYEIWVKDNELLWGINCKLVQCKVFSPFVSPDYCLFNNNITNVGPEKEKIEKMKKIGVPQEAINHYCKKNNIIQDKPMMPKLNFNANDLLAVKLKPVEKEKEIEKKIEKKPMGNIFKPPSVNELLEMKNRLKKVN